MAAKNTETVFDDGDIENTREQVRAIMANEGLNQREISDAAGIPYGTFHGWMTGNKNLDLNKHTSKVQTWLASHESRKRELSKVPQAPDFLMTQSAQRFLDTLHFAQVIPEISLIVGGAGIGKTAAIEQYQATHPNVWVATMDPSCASVNAMMKEICSVLGIGEKNATALAGAIGRKVQGTGGIIIVDEAQHLSTAALDQLRSFYDKYGIGIAIVGNETVLSRLEGTGGQQNLAHLYSRIGVKVVQPKPKPKDMCALIEAWGITEKAEITMLKNIGSKPGALRAINKCLQLASMAAAGAGERRGIDHIKKAWSLCATPALTS